LFNFISLESLALSYRDSSNKRAIGGEEVFEILPTLHGQHMRKIILTLDVTSWLHDVELDSMSGNSRYQKLDKVLSDSNKFPVLEEVEFIVEEGANIGATRALHGALPTLSARGLLKFRR
jgi:hypothetical protein